MTIHPLVAKIYRAIQDSPNEWISVSYLCNTHSEEDLQKEFDKVGGDFPKFLGELAGIEDLLSYQVVDFHGDQEAIEGAKTTVEEVTAFLKTFI